MTDAIIPGCQPLITKINSSTPSRKNRSFWLRVQLAVPARPPDANVTTNPRLPSVIAPTGAIVPICGHPQ